MPGQGFIAEHRVWAALDGWDECQQALAASGDQDPWVLERLMFQTAWLRGRLESMTPHLAAVPEIDQIADGVDLASSYAREALAGSGVAALQNAANELKTAINRAGAIPQSLGSDPGSAAVGLLARLSEKVNEQEVRIVEARKALDDSAEQYGSQLSEALGDFMARAAEVVAAGDQVKTSLGQAEADFNASVDALKARADNVITEMQAQFAAAQETRTNDFNTIRQEAAEQLRTSLTHADAVAQEAVEKVLADLGAAKQAMDDLRAQAEKAVEAIGIAGMAEGFGQTAVEQGEKADQFRIAAIVAMIVFALASLWALHTATSGTGFDTASFLARMAVATGFGSVAAYAITQSAHHRHREREAQMRSLELASIDPYLSRLPEDQQVQIKAELARDFFARPLEPIDSGRADGSIPTPMVQLIETLDRLTRK